VARPNEIEIDGEMYVKKKLMAKLNEKDYVIVRTRFAGVFAGFLKKKNGQEVELVDARRLWQWYGAASLSQLAMEGVKDPGKCKFPCEVDNILLPEMIELIPCTKEAKESIEEVPVWKK